ncbi:hypothetical protein AB0K09_32800, partial [Streptomyces sp. NPDC049577]|uniref:hypothetical protein n=1 Tax=Streptomyces sp. NPDC049577 TaxID=3155153 RepID=UPI003417CE6E
APSPHYAAPETLQAGPPRPAAPAHQGGGHGAARPKRRGLLIAAISVVLVVAAGIGAAMLTNDSGKDDGKKVDANGGEQKPGKDESKDDDSSKKGEQKNPSAAGLMKRDAASLRLVGGATTAKDLPNSKADGGLYVTGMNRVGAAAEWSLDVPSSGEYTVFIGYGVPGADASSTLWVNGKASDRKLNMKNFAQAKSGEWDKGWTRTYAWIDLNKGSNIIKVSCEQGDQCNFNLDQVWLKPGHVNG